MRILCIDPGSELLGLAFIQDRRIIHTDRLKAKGLPRHRVWALVDMVRSLIQDNEIQEVFCEETSYVTQLSIEAKDTLATLKTLIKWECESLNVSFYTVAPNTMKSAVGAKDKKEVLDIVRQFTGKLTMGPDEADAYALAYTVLHNPTVRMTKTEKKIYKFQHKAKAPKPGQVLLC